MLRQAHEPVPKLTGQVIYEPGWAVVRRAQDTDAALEESWCFPEVKIIVHCLRRALAGLHVRSEVEREGAYWEREPTQTIMGSMMFSTFSSSLFFAICAFTRWLCQLFFCLHRLYTSTALYTHVLGTALFWRWMSVRCPHARSPSQTLPHFGYDEGPEFEVVEGNASSMHDLVTSQKILKHIRCGFGVMVFSRQVLSSPLEGLPRMPLAEWAWPTTLLVSSIKAGILLACVGSTLLWGSQHCTQGASCWRNLRVVRSILGHSWAAAFYQSFDARWFTEHVLGSILFDFDVGLSDWACGANGFSQGPLTVVV